MPRNCWQSTFAFNDIGSPDGVCDPPFDAGFTFGSLEGTLFETFGQDLAFVKLQAREMIWTLLAIEGRVTIFSGYHFVNRLGYFVCRNSVEPDAFIAVRIG
jgi:hypothetical protein